MMRELDLQNAREYLHERGLIGAPADATAIEWLAGGVSNIVLRVTPPDREPFVLKQSRRQLRTPDAWYSRLDRIWREADAMRVLHPLLPPGVVPQVLFEDRENYLFLMEAAPADHVVWKHALLSGSADPTIARQLGRCLAALHRETAGRGDLAERFGDTEVFVQLRVDPYYRRIASDRPEVASHIGRLIDEIFAAPVCLVHADFSPKNVLVAGQRMILVDYETVHFGDPAFDLGFFLTHLLLKTILHARRFAEYAALTTTFREEYLAGLRALAGQPAFAPAEIERRTVPHLAACMWARVDGTSRVDYLQDPADRDFVRTFCRSLFVDPPSDWPGVLARLQQALAGRRTNSHGCASDV